MTDQERALIRQLYELQVELSRHQRDVVEALRNATDSLFKSQAVIGQMLEVTAKLAGFA